MKQQLLAIIALFASSASYSALFAQPLASTIAGDGTSGRTDGAGAQAQFNLPYGVTMDAQGNIYVADSNNHLIRKITSAGVVNTIAGDGGRGFLNHPNPLFSSFSRPQGIAADALGNIFIADTGNGSVRKISPTGQVSTFAGNGIQGFQNGPASSARFYSPSGIAVSVNKTLYISDTGNYRIRSIDSLGQVTTLAGGSQGYVDGPAATAQFMEPIGIVRDVNGNILVADRAAHAIRMVGPSGQVSTLAGTGTAGYQDGPAAAARFNSPVGLAVDASGNIYVTERDNHRVRRIGPNGIVSTVAGMGPPAGFADGAGSAARFNGPFGVCYDPATRSLIIADIGNHRIRRASNLPLSTLERRKEHLPLQLYPNPAQASVTLTYKPPFPGRINLTIFDAMGRKVLEKSAEVLTNQAFTWTLSTSALPSGMYLCRMISNKQAITQHLVISH